MRRPAAGLLVAMSLFWNLAYSSALRADDDGWNKSDPAAKLATKTPIKHVVVIFDENISFDHYFGTYPVAANPPGEPEFHATPETPWVNGLDPTLLANNPNKLNGGANPFRLDPGEALTCNNSNAYTAEEEAFDG